MAKVQIQKNQAGFTKLLQSAEMRAGLMRQGEKVLAEAQATADAAQKGTGGKITGYAEAGFSIEYETRGKRPRVVVKSNNTDPITLERVYWFTQKRDGVAHLRAALYKFFPKRGK